MNDSSNNQNSFQIIPETKSGEYNDLGKLFISSYTTSMEINSLQNRAAKSEARLDMTDSKFDSLISEIHSLRWWVLGVVVGGVIAIFGAMVCFAQLQGSWFQDAINARTEATNRQIEEMKASWQAINAEQQKRFELMMQAQGYRIEQLERNQN